MSSGRYDPAERRKAKRSGREKGCWLFVAQEELAKTGFPLDAPPPHYRVWGASRGRIVIQLYGRK